MIEPHHRQRKHQNLFLLGFGIFIAIVLSQLPLFQHFLANLGTFGYFGAYLAGLLFTSTFTVATGGVMLLALAKTLPPLALIPIGALGAITGDILMFIFVKDDVSQEITPIYQKIMGNHFKKILHSRYFAWTLPVIGAIIIASPLPDELAISLLGIAEIPLRQFIVFSFASHLIGMLLIISPRFFT